MRNKYRYKLTETFVREWIIEVRTDDRIKADVAATTGDIQRITGRECVFLLSRNVQERDEYEFIDCRDMENNPVNPEPSPFDWMKDAVLPVNLPNDPEE